MRSMNQIIIAVKECEPCSDEELRCCIAALETRQCFAEQAADEMADALNGGNELRGTVAASLWKRNAENRFTVMKKPVDEYLGPNHIPGTDEQRENLRLGKAIFNGAMAKAGRPERI